MIFCNFKEKPTKLIVMKKQELKKIKKLKLNKIPVSKLNVKGGLEPVGESDFNSVCPMCTG
jgi:hypothetical protein